MLLHASSSTLRADIPETNRRKGMCSTSFERGKTREYFYRIFLWGQDVTHFDLFSPLGVRFLGYRMIGQFFQLDIFSSFSSFEWCTSHAFATISFGEIGSQS